MLVIPSQKKEQVSTDSKKDKMICFFLMQEYKF